MKFRIFLTSLLLLCIAHTGIVSAQTVPIGAVTEPAPASPTLTASPVIFAAAAAGANGPLFVQLYNNSDVVQDVHGWKLYFVASDAANEYRLELATLDTWLQPRGYAVVASQGVVTGAEVVFTPPADITAAIATLPTRTFRLEAPASQSIAPATMTSTVAVPQWQERNKSTSTGKYLETYSTKTTFAALTGGGMYLPPATTAGLEIVEILANARSCSPTEAALDCGDYVKLHNTAAVPVQLDEYRLRTDSGGMKSSATNTVKLAGALAPGAFVTVHLRDSGDTLSITNDGGFVWLEDVYGVQVYEPVVGYPDATNKQGQSWALDGADATWKYMQPAPDAANYWPPPVSETVTTTTTTTTSVTVTATLADCGPGRERNPETNRCRTIASATTSTLTPCAPGQERNPETNRCRNVLSAATTLKACGAGEERNPETNRCRSILTAASTAVKPCPVGQERNPETNRCRKMSTTPAANLATVTDVESVEQPVTTQWLVAGGAVVLALAYAGFEWRTDIRRRIAGWLPRKQ